MIEISPVLAGTFDSPDYAPASINFNTGTDSAADAGSVDPRRYTQFDRTASQVASVDMSFGDVLDMLNPLQHIPVISSIYRAATGDTINPVSRVAGDILYGGALGVASAIASGIGGIADSVMEAKTGKDITGNVYASLFGDDAAANGNTNTQVAADTTSAPATIAAASSTTPPAVLAANEQAVASAQPNQAFLLMNRNKLPYGGVMAPVKSPQEQNMAMALSSATGIRIGNTVYASRNFKNTNAAATTTSTIPTPTPTGTPALTTPLPSPGAVAAETPQPGSVSSSILSLLPSSPVPPATTTNLAAASTADITIPAALNDDALIMKALGLYRSVAARSGNATIN